MRHPPPSAALPASVARSPDRSPRPAGRRADHGFTLTELMVTGAILTTMAAIATPLFTKDNRAADGRSFALDAARELQKCKVEAVTTRLPIRVFVFSDRLEIRPWLRGARAGAPPTAPSATAPLLRTLAAPSNVQLTDVVPPGTSPAAPLGPTTAKSVDFLSQGMAQLVGQPTPTGASIFLQNNDLPSSHPDYDYRLDVTALTAFVKATPQ